MPSRILVLTPTRFEQTRLQELYRNPVSLETVSPTDHRSPRPVIWRVCGFGLINAAIATTQAILEDRPDQVLLVGIAGTYDEQLVEIGQAYQFNEVGCCEIGFGRGDQFRSLDSEQRTALDAESDTYPLAKIDNGLVAEAPGLLLSVAAASASAADIRETLRRMPQAVAEDMEGYAVAAACHRLNRPLTIIRGISNRAGERDKSHWQFEAAFAAAARALATIMGN